MKRECSLMKLVLGVQKMFANGVEEKSCITLVSIQWIGDSWK